MHVFDHVKWDQVFLPQTPLLEIFIRGTLVYLFALLLFRVFIRREVGSMGITDLIVIVFLADAAQNAMAGTYTSVPDGLLLMLVIGGWAYAMDRLIFHFPLVRRLMRPPALPLVENGAMNRRNMRRQFVTQDELMEELRLQGVEDPAEVRHAYLEPDGQISVIKKESAPEDKGRRERRRAA